MTRLDELRPDEGPNSDEIRTVIGTEAFMKEVQVSDGIVPLGEFKAQAAKFLESIAAGLADAEAGTVIDTAALRKLIRSRRKERSRP